MPIHIVATELKATHLKSLNVAVRLGITVWKKKSIIASITGIKSMLIDLISFLKQSDARLPTPAV